MVSFPVPTRPTRRRTRFARSAAGLALVLAGSLVAGCSSSSSTGDSPAPSPSTAAPDSPFSATLVGPGDVQPGDTITATLSNVGRLPDAYQLKVIPEDAAVLKEHDFNLSPGESVDLTIDVAKMPFVVSVESVGGGSGEELTRLDVK